jgi:SPASM domain peptide maturase of grasp-with-spasm system
MINLNLKFKIFADCFPIKGFKRSAIYDLNRKSYKFIPNTMVDFLLESEGRSRSEIKESYSQEYQAIVEEYLEFIKNNEIGFWIDDTLLSNFVKISTAWDYPAEITNAIIDVSLESNYDIFNSLLQLENLGCKHIQIRSYEIIDIEYYQTICNSISNSQYLSVEILTKFNPEDHEIKIKELVSQNKRIKSLVFHSSIKNSITNVGGLNSMGNIAYTKQAIDSPSDCHNNIQEYFNIMLEQYVESQFHHTYYNRKVAIDTNGNIKNCTSHDKIFGNVRQDKIFDIISTAAFQKLWYVSKDKIEICQECEFRHMCIDSRLPFDSENGFWFHKTECNYNPYIAKWKGENGYITVKEFLDNSNVTL